MGRTMERNRVLESKFANLFYDGDLSPCLCIQQGVPIILPLGYSHLISCVGSSEPNLQIAGLSGAMNSNL